MSLPSDMFLQLLNNGFSSTLRALDQLNKESPYIDELVKAEYAREERGNFPPFKFYWINLTLLA